MLVFNAEKIEMFNGILFDTYFSRWMAYKCEIKRIYVVPEFVVKRPFVLLMLRKKFDVDDEFLVVQFKS